MFPSFTTFTNRHPRFVVLLGFGVFISVLNLWGMLFLVQDGDLKVETPGVVTDTKFVLTTPEVGDETKTKEYAEYVAARAVQSDTVTITSNCSMEPLIVRLTQGSVLKIDNRDSVEHTVAFEDQNFFNVSVGQVREINITEVFGKEAGIYRYRCNDLSLEDNVGVMYVTD